MKNAILLPMITLVLWSFVMLAWLYATRIPAIMKNKIVYDPHRPNADFHAQIPARVRWKADNYNNLMEQPTLFYAVVLALVLLGAADSLNVGLAWVYVGLRAAHSLIHALINRIMVRFALFMAGSVVLLVLALRTALVLISSTAAG
jgi:hypothetical protein